MHTQAQAQAQAQAQTQTQTQTLTPHTHTHTHTHKHTTGKTGIAAIEVICLSSFGLPGVCQGGGRVPSVIKHTHAYTRSNYLMHTYTHIHMYPHPHAYIARAYTRITRKRVLYTSSTTARWTAAALLLLWLGVRRLCLCECVCK